MNKFSVLNLSDLHLDSKEKEFQCDILYRFAEELNDYVKKGDHIKWKPEYVVLPGDITNKGHTDYGFAREVLSKFCEKAGIPPGHLIMVPGNHDKKKDVVKTVSQYCAQIEDFEKFSVLGATVEPNNKDLKNFLSHHGEGFKDFNDFHRDVAFPPEDHDFEYIPFAPFEGTALEFVTGVKIFHKNKVCFLNLNTEWLYAKNDLEKEKEADKAPAKREFKVGKNIVRALHAKIMQKCPDYTIITLMHQNPYNLSWFEMNPVDSTGMYTFNFIENCSDIIFSGHDHAVKTDIPDLIKNRVQHFRLGTPCWTNSAGNQDFPYSVSIICVDDIDNKIELLSGCYNQVTDHQMPSWKFGDKTAVPTFPLRNKYEKRSWTPPVLKRKFDRNINLRVKNFSPEVVKGKIYEYFVYDVGEPEVELLIHKIDIGKLHMDDESELKQLVDFCSTILDKVERNGNRLTHLVLYYEITSSDRPEDGLMAIYAKKHEKDPMMEKLNLLRLTGLLVVSVVSVEMPGKFLDSKAFFNIEL